jgi:hypothetical protein
MKAIKEAIAKAAKRDGTPGILAEPTEPGSARKAIEEAIAKLEAASSADPRPKAPPPAKADKRARR